MADDNFSHTSNSIAAKVPCDPGTVRDYADWGWLEHRRLANGVRLFKPSAVEQVRKLHTVAASRDRRTPRTSNATRSASELYARLRSLQQAIQNG